MSPLKSFWETTKKHPYWIGGAVLLGALLIWWFARGGSEAGAPAAGIYAMTQDPNLLAAQTSEFIAQNAANAQIATANIAAQVAGQQIQAELSGLETTAATNISLAQIESQMNIAAATIQASAVQQLAETNAARDISLAQISAALTQTVGAQQLQAQNVQTMMQALVAGGQSGISYSGGGYQSFYPTVDATRFEEMFNNVIRYVQGYQPVQSQGLVSVDRYGVSHISGVRMGGNPVGEQPNIVTGSIQGIMSLPAYPTSTSQYGVSPYPSGGGGWGAQGLLG